MAYYHLYRRTNDEKPTLRDAGWFLHKIEEIGQEELENRTIYGGNYIHRYFIPDKLAEQVLIKKANTNQGEWKRSNENELEPLTDVKPFTDKHPLTGEIVLNYPEIWEIQFPSSFNPEDYYMKQKPAEYYKPRDVVDIEEEFGEWSKPTTLEMGSELKKILPPSK